AVCARAARGASCWARSSCTYLQDVDGAFTGADLHEAVRDRARGGACGTARRVLERLAAREQRGQRRGVRARRTSADVPCTPAAANAFRSAWIPAPPPQSDVAIVSAV